MLKIKNIQGVLKVKNAQQWLLFISCILFLFVLPLFNSLPFWAPKLFITFIFIFALMALEKVNIKFVAICFAAIIIGWITHKDSFIYLSYLSQFISFIFIVWIIGTMLMQLMQIKEVNLISLLEALNGYLLMAIMYGSLVFFCYELNPASYSSAQMPNSRGDLVYYTLITLTTTGYGDIVPLTLPAKELAVLMAMSGQFYVAVIVAIIVGKYSNKN